MTLFDSRWELKHPLRYALRAVGVLSALFCLVGPFVDVPSRWLFVLAGIGYSAFLCFVSAGACLLPHRLRNRILRVIVYVMSGCMLMMMAFLAYLHHFQRVPSLAPALPLAAALGVLIAVLVGFAARGWSLYFSRDSGPTA